jgi:excisionase family DNA binding protein
MAAHDLSDPTVQGPPAPLLTVRDVAARLQVSTTTVYRLRASGQIAVMKVGAALRFRAEDVEAYERRQTVTPVGYDRDGGEFSTRLNFNFPVTRRRRRGQGA